MHATKRCAAATDKKGGHRIRQWKMIRRRKGYPHTCLNCSSKLQFCCDVNSALGDLLFCRGGDLVGVVTCFTPPDGGGGGSPGRGPDTEEGILGRRFALPSPKLLSAIEFMRFWGCGSMGGKLGGMRELQDEV